MRLLSILFFSSKIEEKLDAVENEPANERANELWTVEIDIPTKIDRRLN